SSLLFLINTLILFSEPKNQSPIPAGASPRGAAVIIIMEGWRSNEFFILSDTTIFTGSCSTAS
ncbi:MAG: hypothetical protein LUO90_01830, partial [Methanoregula sp.]|nr:hypothetical protein [Methanoregula sp.]